MVEGYVLDAVETTSGDTWYKARSSDGREYYVHQGEGYVSQQKYAAAKSHSLTASVGERNVDAESLIDEMNVIGDMSVETAGLERGSLERELGSDRNRFLGYAYAKYDSLESDEEMARAIEDYSEFVEEIEEAETAEERQDIRDAYGVGGS